MTAMASAYPSVETILRAVREDAAFKARLVAEPRSALAELGLSIPEDRTIVVVENTDAVLNLIMTAPRYTERQSVYAEIKEHGESYHEPHLASLVWGSRDPVFTARLKKDPSRVVAGLGATVPEDLEIRIVENRTDLAHLVLPSAKQLAAAAMPGGTLPNNTRYLEIASAARGSRRAGGG